MPIIVHDYRPPRAVVASFTHGLGQTQKEPNLAVPLTVGLGVLMVSLWIAFS